MVRARDVRIDSVPIHATVNRENWYRPTGMTPPTWILPWTA